VERGEEGKVPAAHFLPFPGGELDVDTPSDFARLTAKDNEQEQSYWAALPVPSGSRSSCRRDARPTNVRISILPEVVVGIHTTVELGISPEA
jgi:hypothetical protein